MEYDRMAAALPGMDQLELAFVYMGTWWMCEDDRRRTAPPSRDDSDVRSEDPGR
jgi:hypothetical protein